MKQTMERINTVELHHLTLGYGSRVLVAEASVGFGWGELTALIGRNGTGKSTLLRTIAALAKPQSGRITIQGEDINSLSRKEIAARIAFVSTEDVRVQNLHVWDVVSLGRAPYTNWVGRLTQEDEEVVRRSLALVGMSGFEEASMDSLSDGERQRVMIARALAQDTPIILLDEPTAFLDLPNKYEVCLLLKKLAHREGKCIIFSTHDLSIAIEICDTIAMIEGGKFHHGTAEMLIGSGQMQQLFDSTQIEFDAERGGVRLKK